MSNTDKLRLAEKASVENARVLLVGDERQNSSVGAGNPFYLSKRSDIDTAHLEQSVRPTIDYMKEVFRDATKLSATETLRTVEAHGKLIEIKDATGRQEVVAKKYHDLGPDRTLVICKTNEEKGLLTQAIRKRLVDEGDLGKVVAKERASPRLARLRIR